MDDKLVTEKMVDTISELQKTVYDILAVLNDGLKTTVKNNNKKIEMLAEKIDHLEDKIIEIDTQKEVKQQSKVNFREWGYFVVALLSLVVTILSLTGVIG